MPGKLNPLAVLIGGYALSNKTPFYEPFPTEMTAMSFSTPNRIIEFLRAIGLTVEPRDLPNPTFLPGILIEQGKIYYDLEKLDYPGDLLHEAGHLAVVPGVDRCSFGPDVGDDGGLEMAAIAWSYAACLFIGLPVETVFHEAGYRGESDCLLSNFAEGRYLGVPILEWRGMAVQKKAGRNEGPFYPTMKKWLCD